MANIKFVVHGISKDKNGKVSNLEIAIGQQSSLGGCKIGVTFGTGDSAKVNYFTFSFKSFHFKKMMYSPNVIEADFQVGPGQTAAGEEGAYKQIDKTTLEKLFTNKEVSLICTDGQAKNICEGYYIHQVVPRYKSDVMYVTMVIYSPDKLMTLDKYSRTFVAKKLGAEILEKQMKNFSLPYDEGNTLPYEYQSMIRLIGKQKVETEIKDSKGNVTSTETTVKISNEHIFPYLFQYNESFYDFLARTTNRWGEFMFYEDNKLHFGYQTDEMFLNEYTKRELSADDYTLLTLHDLTVNQPEVKNTDSYAPEASYDSNILNSKVTENTYDVVKNTMENWKDHDNGATNYWLSKVSSLLTNDKPFLDWVVNTAIDDGFEVAKAHARVNRNNGRIYDDYFNKKNQYIPQGDEHYGKSSKNEEEYNEFSEYKPIVDEAVYKGILACEIKSAKNVIKIDFDTTYPDLKLGQIFRVMGKDYMVVEVEGYQKEVYKVIDGSVKDGKVVNGEIVKTIDQDLRFRVVAIAADTTFYPMPIEAGHVRTSGPQVAVVVDVDDPQNNNRVRVVYPWESAAIVNEVNKNLKDDGKKGDDLIKNYEGLEGNARYMKKLDVSMASPWLINAAATGTKGGGLQCRHVLGEKVLIDYVYGNVERPYVVGSIISKVPAPIKVGTACMMAPNGEVVKVNEGLNIGATQFLCNLFPATKFLNGFFAFDFGIDSDESMALEGGVDITDKFGIWSIKGSTHERKVSIKSAWGDVAIDAFTGISISAPNGNVKISGKNVTIEAGNNLTLTSGKNIKNKFFTKHQNGNNLGIQVATAVAKKVASIGLNMLDISFLRTIVELFFRPVEGLTTIKSNRFLKLEAGKGDAFYPDVAFANKEKLVKVAKEKMRSTNGTVCYNSMFDKVTKLIGTVGTYSDNVVSELYKLVNKSASQVQALGDILDEFKPYQNHSKNPAFKIEDLKILAFQDNNGANRKEIKEANITFDESVKLEDVKNVDIEGILYSVKTKEGKEKVDEVVGSRKLLRNKVLEVANDLSATYHGLHQLITRLTNDDKLVESLKIESTMKYGFDKTIIDSFKAAKCGDTINTVLETKLSSLDALDVFRNDQNFRGNLKHFISRTIAIGILEAIGYNDETRTKGENDAQPPQKPTEYDDIIKTEADGPWMKYVNSIKSMPLVKKNTKSVLGAVTSALGKDATKALDWNPFTPKSEYYAWADNAKGKILFSSDANTYTLTNTINRQAFTDALASNGLIKEEDNKDAREHITSLREAIKKL